MLVILLIYELGRDNVYISIKSARVSKDNEDVNYI